MDWQLQSIFKLERVIAAFFMVTILVAGLSPLIIRKVNPVDENANETIIAAAELLKNHSFVGEAVDWKAEIRHALKLLPPRPWRSDVETAIQILIASTGEKHTFYMNADEYKKLTSGDNKKNEPIGRIESFDNGVITLKLNEYTILNEEIFNRDAISFRRNLIESIESFKCGIILDLSSNTGGNMYAKLSAIAPLLSTGPLGYHLDKSGKRFPIFRSEIGKDPDLQATRTAVIVGSKTGSSGEYVFVATRASPQTRSFGSPTAGYPTGNIPFELPNGAAIAITAAKLLDFRGNEVSGQINPDVLERSYGTAVHSAKKWLLTMCNAKG